ncbi:WG repeat-containing protein [Roseivirga misakiensis]|uniref:WG repeat-containing protein n=1 Tax=Roseivirga misakiensis TaxID=1563681 RepID=A0A1E5T3H0_9BACT|nr:WG repeat-containing protein [Roseivirga misakiensis]OEK05933.1 hypothetical protein BFP71_07420 [Roseivirga misakiensis]
MKIRITGILLVFGLNVSIAQGIDYNKVAELVFQKPTAEGINVLKDALKRHHMQILVKFLYEKKEFKEYNIKQRDEYLDKTNLELDKVAKSSPSSSQLYKRIKELQREVKSKRRQQNSTMVMAELSYSSHLLASGLGNAANAERSYSEYLRLRNIADDHEYEANRLIDRLDPLIDEYNAQVGEFDGAYKKYVAEKQKNLDKLNARIEQSNEEYGKVVQELYDLYKNNIDIYFEEKRIAEEKAKEEARKQQALSFLNDIDFGDDDAEEKISDLTIKEVLINTERMQYDWDKYSGLVPVKGANKYGYVNKEGDVIIQPLYDLASTFSQGLAAVVQNGKSGFINIKGEVIVPITYEEVRSFSEGLAAVKNDGKWGFIDQKGATVIPFEYVEAYFFTNNLANVALNGEFFYINKQGEKVDK